MAEFPDHYAILGVAPGDDARTIKRAYAAAIRAHPPETDPEGFAAVRRAYEVLSDAAARSGYDEARAGQRPDDPVEAALWAAARRAAAAGDLGSARRLLERLVALRPGALGAWQELGELCLRMGAPAQAVRAFQALAEAFPERLDVQLDLARAHRAGADARATAACVARALELAGADPAAQVEVADLLLSWQDFAGARRILEALLAAVGAGPPPPPVVLRLARVELGEGRAGPAVRRVRAALEAWRAAPRAERLRAVGALTTFALELFEAGREDEGRSLLADGRALEPRLVPDPPRLTLLRYRELHPEDRAWLELQRPAGATPAGQEPPGLGRWMMLVCAATVGGLLALAVMGVLGTRRHWPGDQTVTTALALAAAGLAEVGLVRAAWRRWRGRLPAGALLDHEHLVLSSFDRVRALPLMLVRQVTLKARDNGFFTVVVRLCGSRPAEVVRFATRAAAEAFAAGLMQRRGEIIAALSQGRSPLPRRPGAWAEHAARRRAWRVRRLGLVLDGSAALRVAVVAALAAALAAAGAREGARAEWFDRWARARKVDQLPGYLELAAAAPGPVAREARAAADRILSAAEVRWRVRSRPGPGASLVAALFVPGAKAPPTISATVVRTVELRALAGGSLQPGPALERVGAAQLGEAFRRALRVGLEAGTSRFELPFVVEQAGPGALGLELDLRLVAVPGAFRTGPGRALGVLGADWMLVARPPGGSSPVILAEGRVEPPEELPLPDLAWSGDDDSAAAMGYLALQRALAVGAIRAAVLAAGAPIEPGRLDASIGDLGARLPPPWLTAGSEGGRDGR